MENGSFIGEDYFEHLLAEIREIRLSERRFLLDFRHHLDKIVFRNTDTG